jgi:death-on-curing family protein
MKFNKGEVIIYKTLKGPELEVRLEKETVWLSQKQIAQLFDKGIPAVNEHIKNIYKDKELDKKSTIRKFRIVQFEGKRKVMRIMDFYNLDMIISVGYKVSSKRATQFRIWATKTLKNYLLQGYTINEKVLLKKAEQFEQLKKTISFLQKKAKHELLSGQAQEILNLLSSYAKSLAILEKYDKNSLKIAQIGRPSFVLTYQDCQKIISSVKRDLIGKKEASGLFGQEVSHKFESIVKNLYQTFAGKEFYRSIEEKAANLLYLTIKDHPFIDGNKRLASFLFVYFLERNNYLYKVNGERKINDNALVALALLVAISNPKEKEIMIKIITNLLS